VPRRCSGGRCHLVIHWFIATNRRPLPHPCASHCPALCRFSLHRFPATQALGYYGARIKKPQPPYLGCGSCPRQWPPRLPAHYRPWRRRRFRKLRPAYIRPVIASACRGRYVSHVAEGPPFFRRQRWRPSAPTVLACGVLCAKTREVPGMRRQEAARTTGASQSRQSGRTASGALPLLRVRLSLHSSQARRLQAGRLERRGLRAKRRPTGEWKRNWKTGQNYLLK
jgi:hypothetical protein